MATGLALWVTGLDYIIQDWLAAHDDPEINLLWRKVSLFGLGKNQALVILVLLYIFFGAKSAGIFRFWPKAIAAILATFFRLWFGRARITRMTLDWPKKAQILLMSIPIMFAAGTICAVLKHIIGRPRPKMYLWHNETAIQLFEGFSGRYQSMPSGHVATTFALIGVLWPHFPRLRWLMLVYACISSASRVMSVTPHFVSDVLIGAALGLMTAKIFNTQLDKNSPRVPHE